MINFIFSPILSLFSLKFYRRAAQSSLAKGILYLCYLSFLFCLTISLFFSLVAIPVANEFMGWIKESLPEITFTKEGVTTPATQPFALTHPKWGTVLKIDTSKDVIEITEAQDTYFFMTRTKMYVAGGERNRLQFFDLIPRNEKAAAEWKDFTLTGPMAHDFYRKILPVFFPVVFIVCYIFFFIWKMLAAFFYSVLALIFNLFRRSRLPYDKLLNISFFALTPVTLIQLAFTLLPAVPFRLNLGGALAITGGYLALAILATQAEAEEAPAPPQL